MSNPDFKDDSLLGRLRDIYTAVVGSIVLAAGTNQIGARGKCTLLNSGVLSGDTQVKSGSGEVYWITISDTAALVIDLEDAVGSGASKWGIDLPAAGYGHFIFDPPIEFATGIYLDVDTATCKVTVGYK